MFFGKVFLLIAIVKLSVSEVTANRTKVTVYHESLCPGCVYFITKQLYPDFKKLGNSIQVEMIPYGGAIQTKDANGNWHFTCQHGEEECKGNKYEACAIDQNKEQEVELHFLNCILADKPYDEVQVKACAEEDNYDWPTLRSCAEGTRGSELLAAYGDITHNVTPKLTHVPTIAYNGVYDTTKDDEADMDFLKTTCAEIPAPKPEVCRQYDE